MNPNSHNIGNYLRLIRFGDLGVFPSNIAIILLMAAAGLFIHAEFPSTVIVTTMTIDNHICFVIIDLASLATFMGFEDNDSNTAVGILRSRLFRARWIEHHTSDLYYELSDIAKSAGHQLPTTCTIIFSATVHPGMPEEMDENGVPGVMDERYVTAGEVSPNKTYRNNLRPMYFITKPDGTVVKRRWQNEAVAVVGGGKGRVEQACRRVYAEFIRTRRPADEDLEKSDGSWWNILIKYEEE